MSRVREWPWRWIIPAGLLTVLSVAVVVLGLVSTGGTTAAGEDPAATAPTTYATAASPSSGDNEDQRSGSAPEGVSTLPATKDPDVFSQAVADLVYSRDWHRSPDYYRAALHAGLDPEYVLASEARDAIIATLDARIPEPWLWERMVGAKQTNTFTAEATWEPGIASDPRALEQWPPGVVVRNVQGVQRLRYLNERDEFQTDQMSVTVTVFMVCPPARDHCTLLGVPREVAP